MTAATVQKMRSNRPRRLPPLFRLTVVGAAAITALLLCLPFLLMLLPFALVSWLTSTIARRIEPAISPWREMIEFCPRIGWRPKPLLDAHGLADEIFHITTDSRGWRGRTEIKDSKTLVFGDSFAFGYGVDDADFFAELIGHPVKAVGAPGYNMVQELLLMREMSADLHGKTVIWFVYHGNDLFENLVPNLWEYRMPFVRNSVGRWEIVTAHVCREPWAIVSQPDYYKRLAEMCCAGPVSDRAYAACRYLLEQGRDSCSSVGAALAVVTVPDIYQLRRDLLQRLVGLAPDPGTFDAARPDREIRSICRDLGLPVVLLADHLEPRHYKPVDCHWNEEGHRKVAQVLAKLAAEPGVGKGGAPELECLAAGRPSRPGGAGEARAC